MKQKSILQKESASSKRELLFAKTFKSPQQFLKELNPDIIRERYKDLINEAACYTSNVIKLSELKNIYGEDTVYEFINIWTVTLNDYINVNQDNKMNDPQIQETSRYIYEDFFFLNIAEFALVFKKIKKGEYGEFYGRIDGSTILKCFRAYRRERGVAVVKIEKEKEDTTPMVDKMKYLAQGLKANREEMPMRSLLVCSILYGLKSKKWIGEVYGITWAGVDDIDVVDLVRIEAALPCWAYKDNEDDGFVYIEGADIYLNEEYVKLDLI
jgi:hypothetical protein